MINSKDKLMLMQSNLNAMQNLVHQLSEQIDHASEPAPESYDYDQRCHFLIGGLGNIDELATNINALSQATKALIKL